MRLRQVLVLTTFLSALGCREPIKTTHDPKDAKTCGPSAVDCTAGAPAHGGATCDGTSCGFACDSGYHPTGAACTSDSEITSCGPSGADCVAARPASSSALCNGASCDFACDSGFHRSGTTCTGNGTLTSCGPSGVNCVAALPTNSSATCDGTNCGFDCDADYHQNPAGTACDADTSVTSCGASASDCNTEKPDNSAATCSGMSCGFACVSGHHTCDNLTCSSNFNTATCGTGCSVCPPKLNGYPTCDGTNCGFDCNSDYHRNLAGTACDADTSVSSCGASGINCNNGLTANATAMCDGQSCGFDCNSDFHKTSSTCTSNFTLTSCGPAAADCTTETVPANASASCDGTSCGSTCSGGFIRSGSSCVRAGRMPDSATIFCSDGTQASACPSSGSGFGQDGNYTANKPTYTVNDNGTPSDMLDDTVSDSVTGLTWDRGKALAAVGSVGMPVTYCDDLDLGGHQDWRLPTRTELVSLMDYGRASPAIDVAAFPNTHYLTYPYLATGNSGGNWGVRFDEGTIVEASTGVVRCVRGARQGPPGPFTVVNSNTVRDESTGLMWQDGNTSVGTGAWLQALSTCESLTQDSYTDWRLPSIKEFQTIVVDNVRPWFDPAAFPNLDLSGSGNSYTATPRVLGPSQAWLQHSYGGTDLNPQGPWVLCVR